MAHIVTFAEYGAPDALTIDDIALLEPGPDEIHVAAKAIGLKLIANGSRTSISAGS